MSSKKYLLILSVCVFFIMGVLSVYAASIDKVFWDKVLAKDGQARNIVVATTGYPDDTSVSLDICEYDVGSADECETTLYGVLKNNLLIYPWSAKYQCDGLFCVADPPEYHVTARIPSISRKSGLMDVPDNGNMPHHDWDCGDIFHWEGSNQCKSNLFCEGVPWYTLGSGGASGDGCCYDFENWHIDDHQCNFAIKGQVFNVVSNQDGTFNSNYFSNIPLFFKVYDDTSLIGRIIDPVFIDLIKTDANGNFYYNPEFNRQTLWNANIAFDWNVQAYALDYNNVLIATWTNSFSSDKQKYIRGNDYIDQRVRIHTDKEYWKDYPSSSVFSTNAMSVTTSTKTLSAVSSPIPIEIVEQIAAREMSKREVNVTPQIQMASTTQTSSDDETEIENEEMMYFNWTGLLKVENEDEYSFNTTVQGGYKLTIDNEVIYDTLFSDDSIIQDIYLAEGKYNITIEYVNMIDRVAPNLLWKKDNDDYFELVPYENLIKLQYTYQFYDVDHELNVEPFEKFDTPETQSKMLSLQAASSYKLKQVGFLEAPRHSLNENKNPAVLVHGLHGKSGYFDNSYEEDLQDKGYDVWKFYYPNDQKIAYSSTLLSDGIEYLTDVEYNVNKVDLITHSMGGLVARGYTNGLAQDDNSIDIPYKEDVNKLTMVAPPNHGSYLANRVLREESLGLLCDILNNYIVRLFTGETPLDWDSSAPAYKDLAVGSNFIWNLSLNENSDVEKIVIGGSDNFIPCLPLESKDSDALVSLSSASLLDQNVSLFILDKDHRTLLTKGFLDTSDGGFWELVYAVLTSLPQWVTEAINNFYVIINDITDLIDIMDTFLSGSTTFDSYDYYINPDDPDSFNTHPFSEGTILLKYSKSPTPQLIQLRSNFTVEGEYLMFNLTENQESGIWYHFNEDYTELTDCLRDRFEEADFSNEYGICANAAIMAIIAWNPAPLSGCLVALGFGAGDYVLDIAQDGFDVCVNSRPQYYGLTFPAGIYNIYADDVDIEYSVETEPLQTTILEITGSVDSDGDGFNSSVDCNDEEPSIYPGAQELCNVVDDNCNNLTDENDICEGVCTLEKCLCSIEGRDNCIAAWGVDIVDSDTLGQCMSWWANGVEETCNGRDDDCDGEVDEECIDTDGDNVIDDEDACPTTYGEWCNGCPEPECAQCTVSYCPENGTPSCQNLSSNVMCDSDYYCSSEIGDNNYAVGGDYLCKGYCDGHGSCDYANKCYYTDVCDTEYDKTQDYVNLKRFPRPFVKFGKFNASIILGDNSSSYDVLAATEIGIILQYSMQNSLSYLMTNGSTRDITSYRKIPIGNVILASEFNNTNDNLIIVGEPCSNDLLFTYLNITEEMCDNFAYNKSILKLLSEGDRAILLVIGYTPINTLQAAVALADYEESNLQEDELIITINGVITPTCNNDYNCDYDETFFSCPDDCTYGDEDNDGYNSLIDCNDANVSIYPGAPELCNGVDDNCNNQTDEGYADSDGDGSVDCIDDDDDNDGINDENDPLTGDANSINSTTITPVVEIDGSTDLGQAFSGVKNVVIKDDNETVVEFQFNFSKDKINLYNVTIDKQEDDTAGSIIIKGISLPEGETKTVYVDDLSDTNTLCIIDQEIASITVTDDCTNGVKLTCDGTAGNYVCTDLGDRYKITGLKHSGIVEYTYTPPADDDGGDTGTGGGGGGGGGGGSTCKPVYVCEPISPCSSAGKRTEICTDSECNRGSYRQTVSCTYIPPKAVTTTQEELEEVVEKIEEAPLALEPSEETPPEPTSGMLAITGMAIGGAYQQRPWVMGMLTAFILVIIALFIYTHIKGHVHWPFHFKHPRRWLLWLVIAFFIACILVIIHFVLLSYGGG